MKNKTLAVYSGIGAIVIAILGAVAHTVVYSNQYDFEAALWQNGVSGFMKALSYICLVPMLAMAAVYAFAVKQGEKESGKASSLFGQSLFVRIASLTLSVSLAFTVVAQILAMNTGDRLAALLDPASKDYMSLTSILHIITLVFALPAAYHFLTVFLKKKETVATELFAIAYFIFYTLRVYFDMPLHINNPRWSYGVVVLVAVLLTVTLETHLLVAKKGRTAYALVAFLALTLAFSEALAEITFAIGFYTNDGWSLAYTAVKLAFALFVAARLYTLTASLFEKEDTPAVKADDAPALVEGTFDPIDPADTPDTPDLPDGEVPSAPEGITEEVTREELERFYKAVYITVAAKQGVDETSSEEDKQKVRKAAMMMVRTLLDGGSREESIAGMREFIKRVEGQNE